MYAILCGYLKKQEVWGEQLYRTILGDRLWHRHSNPIEDIENTTLYDIMVRTVGLTDLPFSVFAPPEVSVCISDCADENSSEISLSDK